MFGIPIQQAETVEEIFFSPGVAAALECAFKGEPFPYDKESREYAEVARAYWTLYGEARELFIETPRIPDAASDMPAVVATEAAGSLVWTEEAMDILFRRFLIGVHRAYGDFQQLAAISAFDKRRGLFSADHDVTPNVELTGGA